MDIPDSHPYASGLHPPSLHAAFSRHHNHPIPTSLLAYQMMHPMNHGWGPMSFGGMQSHQMQPNGGLRGPMGAFYDQAAAIPAAMQMVSFAP
jgi:hypothetical protein